MGSVLKTPANGTPAGTTAPDFPTTYNSSNWDSNENKFQGNLLAYQKRLDLPIKLNSDINGTSIDYFELIRRGKEVGSVYNDGTGTVSTPKIVPVTTAVADDEITAKERYYNKTGLRITLADKKPDFRAVHREREKHLLPISAESGLTVMTKGRAMIRVRGLPVVICPVRCLMVIKLRESTATDFIRVGKSG